VTRDEALFELQQAITPGGLALVDDFATMLADVPPEDIERETANIGHIIMMILKRTAPQMSESSQVSLPYAFVCLLRERVTERKN
jgi:hypothetical protein